LDWGIGNFNADPVFADPGGSDGDPDTWADNDYHLAGISLCINAGDPNGDYTGQTDIDGQDRVLLGRVDIGSDEAAGPIPEVIHNVTQDTWHPTVQAAIIHADAHDEIEIPPGTYTGPGNRDLDFGGKALTVCSSDPNDPNVVAATILKCNPDDPNDPSYGPHRGFSFYSAEDANSVVAGLTITNGYSYYGGGIYCWVSSPLVTRCVITGCSSGSLGGGIYLGGDNNAMVTDCTIAGNAGSSRGGGVYCSGGSPVIRRCVIRANEATYGGGLRVIRCELATITHCTITDNWASSSGGGLACYDSAPTLTHCTIAGNVASYRGGGVYCETSSALALTDCTIVGNVASSGVYGLGGGISCWGDSDPRLTNCTIAGNVALELGGGLHSYYYSDPVLTNCILWGNRANLGNEIALQSYGAATAVTFCYSDIRGGVDGIHTDPNCVVHIGPGNIADDPYFVDPPGPDGDPNTWEDNDYHLMADSPCINTGDPNGDYAGQTDIDGHPRLMDGGVDIGSDEYPAAPYYHALDLRINYEDKGNVLVASDQPRQPPAYDGMYVYSPGTHVLLTAEPNAGRSFKQWNIRIPGDPNGEYEDTNNPLGLVMDRGWAVEAKFNCGGGIEPLLPLMVIGLLGGAFHRRRR
jgi:hypothetical protein